MTKSKPTDAVLIPIDRINVLNPRARSRKVFQEIIESIAVLGLKRPITVTRCRAADGPRYDLVCGQGRMEAYQALGQRQIPALIIDASTEECMTMSLVENLARRHHSAVELLQDIQGLRQRGYGDAEIARKTGLSATYVSGVTWLLEHGEHRLLRGVESGQVPLSVAIEIAGADDAGVQAALHSAYESKLLRGRRLSEARRLIEQRRRWGKGIGRSGSSKQRERALSSTDVLRVYEEETERKRILIRNANQAREQLLFVIEALRKLRGEEGFVALLRAEGLDTLPRDLAERVERGA